MHYKVLVSFVSYQFIRSDVIYNMLHLLCFILSYCTVLVYHIILYPVIVYNSVEECIITYYFIVYHSNASCHIISLHIIQYQVTSYYFEMLCHMILWYIVLYQILDTIYIYIHTCDYILYIYIYIYVCVLSLCICTCVYSCMLYSIHMCIYIYPRGPRFPQGVGWGGVGQ